MLEAHLALIGDHRAELGLDLALREAHLQKLAVLKRKRLLGLCLLELAESALHRVSFFVVVALNILVRSALASSQATRNGRMAASLATVRHRFALAACAAGLIVPAATAQAADPIMRLSDVRSGMKCKGLSVVRGTAISQFDVEVLDVISGRLGRPRRPHPDPRVGARGGRHRHRPRLLGLAPILPRRERGAAQRRRDLREHGRVRQQGGARHPYRACSRRQPGGRLRAPAGRPALRRSARPDRHPAHGVRPLARRFARGSLRVAPRAPAPRCSPRPAGPARGLPRPGPAPGLGRVRELVQRRPHDRRRSAPWPTATAARLGLRAPLDGAGRRALLLQDAYVYSVINNPVGTEGDLHLKLAVPGHTVGALTNDAINADARPRRARRRARSR